MWGVGTDRVSYINKADGKWTAVAKYEALADASKGVFPSIPDENLSTFGESSAVGMNTSSMDSFLKNLFGENYPDRLYNGIYAAVDKDNVLYANYNDSIYAFALNDSNKPSKGITKRYVLEDAVTAIQGNNHQANTTLTGLSMTYDGHIVITFSNGVAVIDRDLNASSASFYKFGDDELVTNSLSIDENDGIYVASNTIMRKLVWSGTTLSDNVADGAWSCLYNHSVVPPGGKRGNGTGTTPALMGFGNDPDKLVVITDGAKQMNLVAFWRDNIPLGSQRIAGQIPVTCGFSPLPEWIQTDSSAVVYGYGVFVANQVPETNSPDLAGQNQMLNLTLFGPVYLGSYGVERFQWNTSTHKWSSVWARSDVETNSVPIHSQSGNMALLTGYRLPYGWEVLGLDWNTGKTVHHTIFGDKNFGNGGYAIPEYLENGDLVFDSIVGPIRIHYPVITWSNPTNITYGTALSSTQLDATATDLTTGAKVPGNFVYTPPTGTVLGAGTYTLYTNFTPTDTADYTNASANVMINVTQATPTINWNNPVDVCKGSPLSYDQLDASASNQISGAIIPGTYYYDPGVGTVLSAGQHQPLSVTFVPVDNTNYTTASKTVYINANQCPEKHGFFHQTEYSTFLPFQWG